jgi:hypothetical protein
MKMFSEQARQVARPYPKPFGECINRIRVKRAGLDEC